MKNLKSPVIATLFLMFGAIAPLEVGAADEPPAFALSELDVPPRPITRVVPVYPAEMKSAGLIGKVTVRFVINASGRVINPTIVASNNPWFERPAIDALLQWKYRPGSKGGQAVNSLAEQVLQFELGEGGGDNLWQATKGKNHNSLPLEIRWDKSPEPVASTFPVYPAEALLAKTPGRAVVGFLINPVGRIQGIKLVEASAPEFGAAAIASVDAWRFRPATREWVPCSAVVRMEFDFVPTGGNGVPVSEGTRRIVRELSRKEPRIYPADKLDALPKPVSRRPPIYPSALLAAGQPGETIIEFHIDENGDAQLPRVVSATAPEFGYAAAQAVATWRFEVPRKDGKPVVARVQIPVVFPAPKEAKAD